MAGRRHQCHRRPALTLRGFTVSQAMRQYGEHIAHGLRTGCDAHASLAGLFSFAPERSRAPSTLKNILTANPAFGLKPRFHDSPRKDKCKEIEKASDSIAEAFGYLRLPAPYVEPPPKVQSHVEPTPIWGVVEVF